MPEPIKILHVDPDYQVMLFVIMDGSTIRSRVPLDKAVQMLREESFDLIVDEIHDRAILEPRHTASRWNPITLLQGVYPGY